MRYVEPDRRLREHLFQKGRERYIPRRVELLEDIVSALYYEVGELRIKIHEMEK